MQMQDDKVKAIDEIKQATQFTKNAIKEYLNCLIGEKQRKLESVSKEELYSMQGEIRAYRKLMEVFD